MDWSLGDIESAVLEAMDSAGISPASRSLTLDGKKHRYKIAGDKGREQNGEYCIYTDEWPAGYFKSYKASHGYLFQTWAMHKDKPLSDDERKRYLEAAEAREAERAKRAQEQEKARGKAVGKARWMWEASTPLASDDFKMGYFKSKGIRGAHGARKLGKDIILPLVNEFGEIVSVQTISPNGFKKFLEGTAVGNSYIVLPKPSSASGAAKPPQGAEGDSEILPGEPVAEGSSRVWIVEGWATGATVAEATRERVICALNAGNLLGVSRIIRRKYPDREIVIAADWDRKHGNAGMAAAFEVQDELGLPVVPPKFADNEEGSDWNDFAAIYGLLQTRAALFAGLERVYAEPSYQIRRREKLFDSSSQGRPKETVENLERLLHYLGITIRYNEIAKNVDIEIPGMKYAHDDEMNAVVARITSQCIEYGLAVTRINDYLTEIACRKSYNPVMDWITSKPWDGTPRLSELTDTLHTPGHFPKALKETLVKKWLISAVAAAASQEKEFLTRGVLVLQGGQSKGKTSWLRSLVPQRSGWFVEGVSLDPTNKDDLKSVVSHWIVELGELDGTMRKTDIARLKAFITKGTDIVRLPWAKKFSNFPRRTVLCASVNPVEVLVDVTGNSRWWVVPCERIDYKHGLDMQQVWAEIYLTYQAGVVDRRDYLWWLSPEEEERLNETNKEFEMSDPIEDLILSRLDWDDEFVPNWLSMTATDVLQKCGLDRPSRGEVSRAGAILRKMGAKDDKKWNGRFLLVPPVKRRP